MPAGPIGSVWATGSWSDTAWEVDTWADAGTVFIPAVLGDLTQLWTQEYQPALHAVDPGDDTTLVALDEDNLLNYDNSRDKNTDAAKYIDTEF